MSSTNTLNTCDYEVIHKLKHKTVHRMSFYTGENFRIFKTRLSIESSTQCCICFPGPTGPSVAGYLTAGTRSTMPDRPPPVDRHDDLMNWEWPVTNYYNVLPSLDSSTVLRGEGGSKRGYHGNGLVQDIF